MPALVIGNGESRSNLFLDNFKKTHTLVGCNAVYRDFSVDYLVCCDQRMVKEALENGFKNPIYTRLRYYQDFRKIKKYKNVFLLPSLPYQGETKADDPLHWGSGPYALLLASVLEFKEVDIIGFDLYGKNDKINNVYKGSKNYSTKESNPVDHSYWVYQIKKIFDNYPNTQFNLYNEKNWLLPREWTQPNVKFLDVKALTINTVLV